MKNTKDFNTFDYQHWAFVPMSQREPSGDYLNEIITRQLVVVYIADEVKNNPKWIPEFYHIYFIYNYIREFALSNENLNIDYREYVRKLYLQEIMRIIGEELSFYVELKDRNKQYERR